MSQNDYVIANQTAPNFRADLNLALQALASNSSGATAPATTYANMLWYDTAANTLYMRSEANDAWISIGYLDQSLNTFTPFGVPEPSPFIPTPVTGTTPSLDLGSFNFFDNGTLSGDTTVTFASVPTEARWSYSFNLDYDVTYDISNGSYDNKSFITAGATGPQCGAISTDGNNFYIFNTNTDSIYQYPLSTPWDISSASTASGTKSVGSEEGSATEIFFRADGTKLYILGTTNDTIYQYTLSTPWVITTASYDTKSFSVASQDTIPRLIFFKPDGTKLYSGGDTSSIYQYTLSTPWDVSTASYDSVSFSIASQDSTPTGLYFTPDGSRMFMLGIVSNIIYQYTLSTPWDISTASYDTVSFSVAAQVAQARSIDFGRDGAKVYILANANDTVYQYTVGSTPTLTLPAAVENPPTETILADSRVPKVTYDFYTLDGGTNVYLINEEVL